jgi:hypothetical protein
MREVSTAKGWIDPISEGLSRAGAAEVQKLRADSRDDGPCYQDLGVEAGCIGIAGDHRDEV